MKAFTKEGLLEHLKEKLADLNDNHAKALELYNLIVSKVK